MNWVFVIIAGIIIGLLGKFFAPGDRDNIPLWLTVVCGVAGVLIGFSIFGATSGIDWVAWIVSLVLSVVLVMIAATLTGRRSHT